MVGLTGVACKILILLVSFSDLYKKQYRKITISILYMLASVCRRTSCYSRRWFDTISRITCVVDEAKVYGNKPRQGFAWQS